MQVSVAYALPDVQFDEAIELPEGATVADALAAVANQPPFEALDLGAASVGVFNRLVRNREQPLTERDRIEIYRPLEIDPMAARSQRAALQGD